MHALLLKPSPFSDVSMSEIVQQIKGRKVAEKKFPFLLKGGIVFPPQLNLEQTSSQATAIYKSSLVKGKSFTDLTSGFGIDAYFFSENFDDVTLVEQNLDLLELVKHNWNILGKEADFVNQNLKDFLKENSKQFDLIYLDPARRDQNKNKVFLLEDLSPNLLEIQESLKHMTNRVMIKLSPLIDISYLVSVLNNIVEIHIVAVKNEVKEILVLQDFSVSVEGVKIVTVNLDSDEPIFSFNLNEKNSDAEFSEPLQYLYIPNNSVLKSGAFNLVAHQFNLKKLHPNTHLYTSQNLVKEFPGRILKVETLNAKQIKKGEQYNLVSKNHPLKPEDIKKKFKLKDGGNRYLVFTQSINGKEILRSILD